MSKLNSIIKSLKTNNRRWKNFGGMYAISYFINRKLFKSNEYKNRKMALNLMEKKYSYIFVKYKNIEYHISTEINNNIFVYWNKGFENLPEVVRICLDQVKKFYGDEYDIHLIDDNNVKDYIVLDEKIWEYYKNKKISIQTFSDILRVNLLYKYGGCWFDSTLLMLNRFPLKEMILKYGYYSLNHKSEFFKDVYDVTWTTYFQCCDKGNPNMGACVEYYNEYYKTHDFAIDYFMTDYILCLCSKYGIGNNQLKNILFCEYDPFVLYNYVLENTLQLDDYTKCSQKLAWYFDEEQMARFKDALKIIY